MVPLPTATDVNAYLGGAPEEADLVSAHLASVTALARSYTRGVGFSEDGAGCEPDLAAVIVSATARSVNNPTKTTRMELASYSEVPAPFNGWTLIELAALHTYRRRAA